MTSVLKRAAWMFMAILFVVTGLGVGVLAFWQATHPPKDNPQTTAQTCTLGQTSGEILPVPDTFMPDGDVTTLSTTDLTEGTGAAAKGGDCITAKYYGTFATSGAKFDEDFTTPQAIKFTLGEQQVIPGWDQGLVGMKAGGTRRLVIPSDLAYGSQANGAIPANSDLVFVVKLEAIQ